MRYCFSSPQLKTVLNNGLVRCFFDEQIKTETITTTDQETGETITEEQTIYSYDKVDMKAPLDYHKLVNAIIRTRYSQDVVEAIFRHMFAGEEVKDFDKFNTFAEDAKTRAQEILNYELD